MQWSGPWPFTSENCPTAQYLNLSKTGDPSSPTPLPQMLGSVHHPLPLVRQPGKKLSARDTLLFRPNVASDPPRWPLGAKGACLTLSLGNVILLGAAQFPSTPGAKCCSGTQCLPTIPTTF